MHAAGCEAHLGNESREGLSLLDIANNRGARRTAVYSELGTLMMVRDAAGACKNTTKCVGTGSLSTYDVDAIVRMGAAVAGGEDKLRERPLVYFCECPVSPLKITRDAAAAGMSPVDYVTKSLQDGSLRFSCEQPDHPNNLPRNMFIWRSHLLGSSGQGHEYMTQYLLCPNNGVMNEDPVYYYTYLSLIHISEPTRPY